MQVGWVADPLNWDRWPEAEALLEKAWHPSAGPMLDTNYLVWAVLDGDDLLAAATARLTEDDECEVILVGGRDRHRWLAELDQRIGAAASEAGATRMVACGRRGWVRELGRLGWDSEGEGRQTAYSRELGG